MCHLLHGWLKMRKSLCGVSCMEAKVGKNAQGQVERVHAFVSSLIATRVVSPFSYPPTPIPVPPSSLPPPPCQHADASVSSSQNRLTPSSRLQSPTRTRMFIISNKQERSLKPTSAFCRPAIPFRTHQPPRLRAYAARMSFYRLKQFQCEVTGKSGLDYFQALESEQHEAQTMHSRFPEPLKPAVLKAVQWRTSSSYLTSSLSVS